ncbi:heterokaryon incompatibility protein-domain-containing protein [Paraphoma chrysanthemicola]|uniref:Heterokaryon incompatibility protein-domain-containing protein n=1 Tax=Paraphoma chrysanthemicola TaxID=798071 RepID=A0A8K0RIA5_9PLEO|nr:heterokaryon incompatibility protein-domain-containing protein [Paraphoma chrysanthemicola]
MTTDTSSSTQSPASEQFEYEALNLNTSSFRLLKVLPTKSEEGYLQLKLWHDDLSTRPKYRCLSYRWGDQSSRKTVVLNGKSFMVLESLYHFLEEMHTYSQGLPQLRAYSNALWVDSICIDQQCVKERGHQVQRMGKIYAEAYETLIWLGKQRLSKELHGILMAVRYLDGYISSAHTKRLKAYKDQLNQIRYNEYWSRAWIVQEVLLASSVTIVFPEQKLLDWGSLGRNLIELDEYDRHDVASQLYSFRQQEVYVERWKPMTFWELMYVHRNAQCSDHRDRVYSLLGLVNGGERFAVDYGENVIDLFWRVGEFFDAWGEPELVNILRIALFPNDEKHKIEEKDMEDSRKTNPLPIIKSLEAMPDLQVRLAVRRAAPTASLLCRLTKRVKCKFKHCRVAPRIECGREDLLLCTNADMEGSDDHGCIHALAHPLDQPAAERFEIRLTAHHQTEIVTTVLPPTSLQVYDDGTETWFGISTWTSLCKALDQKTLDRADRVKLQVPAMYAIWIWFGVHPNQIDEENAKHHTDLPSAHHALPPGTKVTQNSIEVPPSRDAVKAQPCVLRQGVFE